MKKINLKISTKLIYIIVASCIFYSSETLAESGSSEYVFGKVVYSDNLSPVDGGNIRVIINDGKGEGRIIETGTIQNNGSFRITKKTIMETDGIKIMAYPNDNYDNSEEPPHYEPAVIEASASWVNSDPENAIIIKVDRIKSKLNKSQGKNSKSEKTYLLKQNFPNPFNPSTLITFDLPQTSNVNLRVYNMNGETVATLLDNKSMGSGTNTLEFNAGDLPSGIYVYSLQAGNYSETRKMMLIK